MILMNKYFLSKLNKEYQEAKAKFEREKSTMKKEVAKKNYWNNY